jgi:hypothetical protein
MAGHKLKIWFDPEGDYLEVTFDEREGYFRQTSSDQVMERIDEEGNILGFSVLGLSSMKGGPFEVAL